MSALPSTLARPASTQQIREEWARRHLLDFIQYAKPDYQADRFHVELCKILEQFLADVVARKSPRVIVVAPPQHGKTTVVSRYFPAWAFGRHGMQTSGTKLEFHIIGSTYAQNLADDTCHDIKRIMDSGEFQRTFKDTRIPAIGSRDGRRRAETFELLHATKRGLYRAAGRGASPTGRPAHIVLIDDLLKDETEAMSESTREEAWSQWETVLRPRLQEGGGALMMFTRWHMDDPIGRALEHMLSGAEDWTQHLFPALSPYGGCDWRTAEDDALSPTRYSQTSLKVTRSTIAPARWAALYQGSPVPLSGNILPADKWNFYGGPQQPAFPSVRQFDAIIDTWDGSFKDADSSDFTSGMRWGIRGAERWLFPTESAYVFEQMAYPRFKQAIRQMYYSRQVEGQGSPTWSIVEDKANGPAVISDLKSEISITAIEPQGGKIARAWAASGDLCAGNCFLPDPSIAPWVTGFVNRCNVFPANINKSGSDDDVDAFTQMIAKARGAVLGLVQHTKGEIEKMNKLMQSRLTKPEANENTPTCPKCGATSIASVGDSWRCGECSKQWKKNPDAVTKLDQPFNRANPTTRK